MRPHPQIAPYVRRPTRDTAELVVPMAPEAGDPVPSLVIPLDVRAATRMLETLMGAWRAAWMEAAGRATFTGAPSCDTSMKNGAKSHGERLQDIDK